jgi:ribosome biogenesis GTPase / thiamine phosphate phosphatase
MAKKIRADFRKNRNVRPRRTDWTRQFGEHGFQDQAPELSERVSGKGELSRRRTVLADFAESEADSTLENLLDVKDGACCRGRVLAVHGLTSRVLGDDGHLYQCAVRRILKTLSTEQKNPVTAGDRVLLRAAAGVEPREGFITRVERRHGTISRAVRSRQQVLVTNVDQFLIVASVAEPYLKPNLIDRMLVVAEQSRVRPVICINKIDLGDPAAIEPLVGVYSRMGYRVLLVSAKTGFGIERFRRLLAGQESVVAGQSGVGKSSLLNAVDPDLHLRVGAVSRETEKGRHTTTTATLLPIAGGGYVVDTPGMRQFELWDVIAEEVAGCFRDLRPYVSLCRFPDCTHTHEEACAVKAGVARGALDARRYESYCHLVSGME